jgi:hypothetical protein
MPLIYPPASRVPRSVYVRALVHVLVPWLLARTYTTKSSPGFY